MPINSPRQVLFASLIGTTIEFFDFYIYATAAVLIFPKLFFPASDPASATLASLATFGIAFVARPIGSALFGHFGDRVGRKATLVAALLTMGLSTVTIGALPTYASIGLAAPSDRRDRQSVRTAPSNRPRHKGDPECGQRGQRRRGRIGRGKKQLRKNQHRGGRVNVEVEELIVVPIKLAESTWREELMGISG